MRILSNILMVASIFLFQIFAAQTVLGNTSILEGRGTIDRVAVSPSGELIAAGSEGGTVVRNTADGAIIHEFDRQTNIYHNIFYRVMSLAFSNSSQFLAVASVVKPSRHEIKIWDVVSGQLVRTIETRADRIQFSPDDSMLIAFRNRKLAQKWNIQTGALVTELSPGEVGADWTHWESPRITQDANRLLISLRYGSPVGAHIIDFSTGGVIQSFSAGGIANEAVFNHDESRVITFQRGNIEIWDATTGQRVQMFRVEEGISNVDIVPSPRSNQVIVIPGVIGDVHAFVLDIELGQRVFNIGNPNLNEPTSDCARFNRNGNLILSTDYGKTRIYDAANGELLRTLPAHGTSSGCNAVLSNEDSIAFTFTGSSQNLYRTLLR